jgi:hypothetical protein
VKSAINFSTAKQYRKMSPVAPDPPLELVQQKKVGKELTRTERQMIISRLLWTLKERDGIMCLKKEIAVPLMEEFHVSRWTLRRIWNRALENSNNFEGSDPQFSTSLLKRSNCGRNEKWNRDDVREAVKEIPLHKRRTIRSLAAALKIPKSTLFTMMKEGRNEREAVIMPVSLSSKPMLTEEHKSQRVFYCCSFLNNIVPDRCFHDYYDHVHIDEKWFFISEVQLRVYVTPDEILPNRQMQNKDHILKVMFLSAVARPRYNNSGDCTFDGKIGMWPFIERKPAQRTSVRREKGTIITTTVSCNRERYRNFLCKYVVPAIKQKWPDRNRSITIQQDGASAHISDDDFEFKSHAQTGLWNIKLLTQPAKSPDLNVLDLSFFRALQSAQWDNGFETTIDGLVDQVLRAYADFVPRKIDKGFLTLMGCMDEILKIHGANDYKIPHIGKEALLLDYGRLPNKLACSDRAFEVYQLVMEERPRDFDDDDSEAEVEEEAEGSHLQMI